MKLVRPGRLKFRLRLNDGRPTSMLGNEIAGRLMFGSEMFGRLKVGR